MFEGVIVSKEEELAILQIILTERKVTLNKNEFSCIHCGKLFDSTNKQAKHIKQSTVKLNHQCSLCCESFANLRNLGRHQFVCVNSKRVGVSFNTHINKADAMSNPKKTEIAPASSTVTSRDVAKAGKTDDDDVVIEQDDSEDDEKGTTECTKGGAPPRLLTRKGRGKRPANEANQMQTLNKKVKKAGFVINHAIPPPPLLQAPQQSVAKTVTFTKEPQAAMEDDEPFFELSQKPRNRKELEDPQDVPDSDDGEETDHETDDEPSEFGPTQKPVIYENTNKTPRQKPNSTSVSISDLKKELSACEPGVGDSDKTLTSEQKLVTEKEHAARFAFDVAFVLRQWGYLDSPDVLAFFDDQSGNGTDGVCHYLIQFLRGQVPTFNTMQQVANLLKQQPENQLGTIPVALMILVYVMQLDFDNIKMLLKKIIDDDTIKQCFKDIVQNVALVHLRKRADLEYPDETILLNIPPILESRLEDIVSSIRNRDNRFWIAIERTFSQLYLTMLTTNTGEEARTQEHENRPFPKFFHGESVAQMQDRWKVWNKLCAKVIDTLQTENSMPLGNTFELLLLQNLESRIGTTEYLKVKLNGLEEEKPFLVHAQVVERFGGFKQPQHENVMVAEIEMRDIQTMYNLLYIKSCDSTYLKGRITNKVFQIATYLGIKDMDWFLFREESYKKFFTVENKVDMLQIIVKLNREDDLTDILNHFESLYTSNDRKKILLDLSPSQVTYFINSIKHCDISEEEIYHMLEQWSYNEAKKEQTDSAVIDQAAKDKFQMVSGCLRFERLVGMYGKFKQMKLINPSVLGDIIHTLGSDKSYQQKLLRRTGVTIKLE